MGYHSHVIFAAKDELFKELFNKMNDSCSLNLLEATSEKKSRDGWTMFYWSDVKWYDSFEEVEAFSNFISDFDSDPEKCEEFEYHILGEDADDYVVKGARGVSPFNVFLQRSLYFE